MAQETDKVDVDTEQTEVTPNAPEPSETSHETPAEAPEEEQGVTISESPANGDTADTSEAEEADSDSESQRIDLLMDVALQVSVELGRKEMLFGEILQLGKGSVIELDKFVDEPVDIYVNQSKVAQGEVVVVDEHFGVRITQLVKPSERMKRLE